MFTFQTKLLQEPTTATTIRLDAPTDDAAKTTTTTTNYLHSRLMLGRQRRAKNEPQQCARPRYWR
jgi:hypothetical protein